jgi:DNA-binding HxlR family transcriptional regulator
MVRSKWAVSVQATATLRAPVAAREGGTLKLLGNGKLTAEFDTDCGATREVLNRVGDKWSVLVVVLLGEGTLRFNELRRSLAGISQRMLTSTLRGLERDGLVKRTVRPTNPPQVEYALTKLGQSLLEPVRVLAVWAQSHRAQVMQARAAFEKAAPKQRNAQLEAKGS